MKIKPEDLLALTKIAHKDGSRHALNGVYFTQHNAIASDGHLYLSCNIKEEEGEEPYHSFIAPLELFSGLKKSTKNNPNIVDIQVDLEGRITLYQDGVTKTMSKVDAKYPKFTSTADKEVVLAYYDIKLVAKLHTVLNIIEKTSHYIIPKGDKHAGVVEGERFTAFIMPYTPYMPKKEV